MTNITASSTGATLTSAIYLGATSFTIASLVVVSYTASSPGYAAVYGDDSAAWTITNNGTVTGVGSANGILLASPTGGYTSFKDTIVNQGTISGGGNGSYGIRIYNQPGAPAYITNFENATIQGGGGVFLANPGSVTNHGVIIATAGYGVELSEGGSIFNDGTITGVQGGVYLDGSDTDAVTNAGLITASGDVNYAVLLGEGGSVDNTGTIQAHSGIQLNAAGTVTNEALINGTAGNGIRLQAGGVVDNTGTILGSGGVYVAAGIASTVTNAGIIDGGVSNDAVNFAAGNPSSTLIVDAGASFTGAIYGGGATIEMAAGDGGTLAGFGVSITNFSTLAFAANADWTVSANYSEGGFGDIAITGFVAGDTIELENFNTTGQAPTYDSGDNQLYVFNAAGDPVNLNIQGGTYSASDFTVSNVGANAYIVDCFTSGTHIAALKGAVPIEDLVVGDLVNAHFSGAAPVKWIGRRHVDCTRHPDPSKVWPVRVAAGTFGPSQPSRDLTLSPNHAVYVRGELIPISRLINGLSIVQTPVDEITYYHLELAEHDLLLAEGLLAESYLDVGDRANFANGGEQLRLYPDFATTSPDVAAAWETRGCATLILRGPRLEAVRSWLNEMALPEPLAAAA